MPRPDITNTQKEEVVVVGNSQQLQSEARKKQRKFSVLSRPEILRALQKGKIRIEPFDGSSVQPNSVDVRLGEYYYREKHYCRSQKLHLFNMFDSSTSMWSKVPRKASRLIDWILESPGLISNFVEASDGSYEGCFEKMLEWMTLHCRGVRLTERVIVIHPGETILGHTDEFIGGLDGLTTMLKTRSSMGRNNIGICKCAGWGDTGYVNRWTLEITNFSRTYATMLVCGRRVGQVVFFRTGDMGASYEGKYQTEGSTFEELMENWHPNQMLPQLHKDAECPRSIEEQLDGIDSSWFREMCGNRSIILK